MTKTFMSLLVVTAVVGLVLGGVFSAGVALGKRQGQQTAFAQEPDLPRQQSRNELGQGGLTGVIEKMEGDTLTINTFQGALPATLKEDTSIGRFTEGVPEDLQAGMRITVVGQRGEDGTIIARSVLLNPEDAFSFFDRGFYSGDSRQPGQTSEASDEGSQEHGPNWGGGNNFFFGGGQGHGPTSGGTGGSSGQHSP